MNFLPLLTGLFIIWHQGALFLAAFEAKVLNSL
jgi:hypothetical protein